MPGVSLAIMAATFFVYICGNRQAGLLCKPYGAIRWRWIALVKAAV
jgi:hypothetical protein